MKKFLTLVLVMLITVCVGLWLFVDPPLSSPVGENPVSRFLSSFPRSKTKKIVYGFLPYWNMNDAVLQPELTHLAYFSLTIAPDGTFVTRSGGGTEPGYRQLQSENFLRINNALKRYNSRLDIAVTQFDNESIEEFLGSPEAQQTFLQSLDSLLLAYPINGVNLDIEYSGDAPPALRAQYTQFVQRVSEHLDTTYGDIQLSVDMYGNAASKQMLWDVPAVEPLVDYIIVMAYDFTTRGSLRSGAVAPLLQESSSWKESVHVSLQDFLKVVPAEKILLGIPFYGYEWQTTSTEPNAFTLPNTGATASYKRVKEMIANKSELGLTEHWDEQALTPFVTYTRDRKSYTIYYENARSVAYKLEFVNQLDLAGIAIWSLGYDGDSRDLWDSIHTQLETP